MLLKLKNEKGRTNNGRYYGERFRMKKQCIYCGSVNISRQCNICEVCIERLNLINKLKLGFPTIVHGKPDDDGMHEIQCPNCHSKHKIKLVHK